jgi:F0F1-type ATP synthase epsilon subunit
LAGVVGVLAKHVPTIGVLKPGVVDVTDAEGLFEFETFRKLHF